MESIETLMTEHRVIERVLDALEHFGSGLLHRGQGEPAELGRFVAFLREFADGQHHAKEEDVLFVAMVEHGFPARSGPIAVMRDEHERGRALVRRLAALAEQPGGWGDGERAHVAETASTFARLLRAHIQKEDGVLYPLAEQHLPGAARAAVDAACAALDAGWASLDAGSAQAHLGRGERPRQLLELADALVARHGGDHPDLTTGRTA